MTFAERLKKIRLEKGLSKIELGKLSGIHHAQIGRYENKGAHPSADVLAKIANTLDVSVEYLLNGSKDNLANNTLSDKELLNQFKAVEQMDKEDKNAIKNIIDAFIKRSKLKNIAAL